MSPREHDIPNSNTTSNNTNVIATSSSVHRSRSGNLMRHRTCQQRQHASLSLSPCTSPTSNTPIPIPVANQNNGNINNGTNNTINNSNGHVQKHIAIYDDADTAGGTTMHLQHQPTSATTLHSKSQPQHDFPVTSETETCRLMSEGALSPSSRVDNPSNLQELAECGGVGQNGNGTFNDAITLAITPLDGDRHNQYHTPLLRSKLVVLGIDISHLSRKAQFIACATGVFGFSLVYGYLQELISVTLCNRELGLFIAMLQFSGYTFLSSIMHAYVSNVEKPIRTISPGNTNTMRKIPMRYYLILSLLRAVDAACTNMAMAYINYPAKTLMKSSRVVFTMLFGALIGGKRYTVIDYSIGTLMVSGLVIFMHADAKSSAVFQPVGIFMLTFSLLCDGAVSNLSEKLMNQYEVGQDEFIYNLYSLTTLGILAAATVRGDLMEGLSFIQMRGTLSEIQDGVVDSAVGSWSVGGKVVAILLFCSAGFFGSSCSAAITKEFGALTMSITSTARKATTLFLSFALFGHVCTLEHVSGIVLFITALVIKSLRTSRSSSGTKKQICSIVYGGSTDASDSTTVTPGGDDSGIGKKVKRRKRRHNPNLVQSV